MPNGFHARRKGKIYEIAWKKKAKNFKNMCATDANNEWAKQTLNLFHTPHSICQWLDGFYADKKNTNTAWKLEKICNEQEEIYIQLYCRFGFFFCLFLFHLMYVCTSIAFILLFFFTLAWLLTWLARVSTFPSILMKACFTLFDYISFWFNEIA